jgi:hypothetical protein
MINFSPLMSAVKPKDRTDQYKILSALLELRAYSTSVTAKQVIDLLKLHFGAKTPVNVNASLRKYSAYVAPAEKGPPHAKYWLPWSPIALDRVKALAPQHPEWKTKEPFASLLKGDVKSVLFRGNRAMLEMVMATHAGMTTEEFEKIVTDWRDVLRTVIFQFWDRF